MTEPAGKNQVFIAKLSEITLLNLGNENFGVKELARESGMSQYTLYRRLYSITGKTITRFIREIRLQNALEMLQHEEVTASEVAYKVGFNSPTYFNKCFHELFGYPPGKVSKGSFEIKEEIKRLQLTVQQGKKRGARLTLILVSSLFLAVSVILIYKYFIRIPEKGLEKSIAVLPFKNLNDTLANQYFFDGIMEEILTDLSRIHDLRVISRSSVEQFRESKKSAPEMAEKLGVNYIVEGSGQKYGNTLRLRVQLIKAKGKESHLWAESYEQEIRGTKDIFGIQSKVAQSIAAKLKATITPQEKQLIEKIPTKNLTAYDFYRRGREEHWFDNIVKFNNKNKWSLKKAENLYRKALENDSAFALAYLGLAKIYWDKYHNKTEIYFTENYLDSVLFLCNIALSYDDQLADAHTFKGKYYRDNHKPEEAFREYDKAISLNPNDWMAYWEKGDLYFWQNDFVHSLELSEKAISLYRGEELPDMLRSVGEQFMNIGFPEKAYYYWKQTLDLDNDSSMFYNYLSLNEYWLGNFEKAIVCRDKAYSLDSTFVDYLDIPRILSHIFLGHNKEALKCLNKHFESNKKIGQKETSLMSIIGYIYWINGDKEKAEYYFEETIKDSYRQLALGRQYTLLPYVYFDLADIYAFRGEKEKAFKYLRIYSQNNCGDVTFYVNFQNDPLLSSIRNEPEFQDIFKEVEAKYQAEHEKVRKWLEERGEL
jgi:TolB-like protein/AraC-like DNA-binding protein